MEDKEKEMDLGVIKGKMIMIKIHSMKFSENQ